MRQPADEVIPPDATPSHAPAAKVMPPRCRAMMHLAYAALVVGVAAFVVAMAWLVSSRVGDDRQSDAQSVSSQAASASVSGEAASGSSASAGASDAGADASQSAGGQGASVASDYRVVTDDFEFDLPEYWRGKVYWETGTNNEGMSKAVVYPNEARDVDESQRHSLVSVEAVAPDSPAARNMGDYISHVACKVEGAAKTVVVHSTNWPQERAEYLYRHPGETMDAGEEALYTALIDLVTGGKFAMSDLPFYVSHADSLPNLGKENAHLDVDYVNQNLRPAIEIVEGSGNEAAEASADDGASDEAARKQAAEEFARLYIGTCTVVDAATGETEQIADRYARIMEYVEPGSPLEAELNAKPRDGDGFMSSVAVAVHDCSANSVYGNTVVVAVSQSATQGNAPNWLQETNALMLHCTFADDGLISKVKQDGIVKISGSVS